MALGYMKYPEHRVLW